MNTLKESVNLPLLYEVRKDAFIKSREALLGNTLFPLIFHMGNLSLAARQDGLLAMEEAAQALPSDIKFYSNIQTAASYICDGLDADDLIEILTSSYWAKNLQGEDALSYYIIILSMIRIQDMTPPYILEQLLISCLSESDLKKYSAYKIQQEGEKTEPDPLEHFLCHELDVEERALSVAKKMLEAKIENASKEQLKKAFESLEELYLQVSLNFLSMASKKKLCSIMPKRKANEYAQNCECMGPVCETDIIQAFMEFIAILELEKDL